MGVVRGFRPAPPSFIKTQLEERLYSSAGSGVHAIEVHVSRLRKKLGHAVVETVRGIGYRLGDTR